MLLRNTPFLESSFKLVFPKRLEYEISPQEMILVVTKPETAWKQKKALALEEEMSRLLSELRQTVKHGCRPKDIRPFIRRIDESVDMAIKYYDIDRKVELLQTKRIMLDYLVNIGKEFEEYYYNELMKNLNF